MNYNFPIAGGMFGEEQGEGSTNTDPCFLRGTVLQLFNARSGLQIVCDLLKPERIWMPSFICHSMVDAIPGRFNTVFYPISENLGLSDRSWIKELNRHDLVIFVDYFGFDLHRAAMAQVKKRGAWILQDAAQALLSSFDRPFADFILFSPRKFVGIPDGGILLSNCEHNFSNITLSDAPEDLSKISNSAFKQRTQFDRDATTPWFDTFQEYEALNRAGCYKISDTTRNILDKGMPYDDICHKRREIYNMLGEAFPDISLFSNIAADVVPLGFPVMLHQRDIVMTKLFEEHIFCPVHWKVDGFIPKSFRESHALSSHILTLICDQRISNEQLEQMIEIVHGYK